MPDKARARFNQWLDLLEQLISKIEFGIEAKQPQSAKQQSDRH